MVVGDVKSAIISLATGATTTIRPAAGEQWLIFGVGSDKAVGTSPNTTPQVSVDLFDGTNASRVSQQQNPALWFPNPVLITNAIYLRLTNDNAATALVSYWGLQIT